VQKDITGWLIKFGIGYEKECDTMTNKEVMEHIKGGLIVSCQALENEPLYRPEGGVMPLMAKAAQMGGAKGIRANTVRDITQIKEIVKLPVIGIIKKEYPRSRIYITTTMKEADELVDAGVDILAFDGTETTRPDGAMPADFIKEIKDKYPDQLLMADIARVEEAQICADAGVDFVGTTLFGYTPETQGHDSLNLQLIKELVANVSCNVIAEGHVHYPEQARKCLECGAYAVVVGGAITRPMEITARFVSEMRKFSLSR